MFLGTFLIPIFVILLFNILIFVLVVRALIKHKRQKKIKFADGAGDSKVAMIRNGTKFLLGIISIMTVFGLMWILAALTFLESGSMVFEVLFIFANIFQGLLIFFFQCIVSEDSRKLWMRAMVGMTIIKKKKKVSTKNLNKRPVSPSNEESTNKSYVVSNQSVELPVIMKPDNLQEQDKL